VPHWLHAWTSASAFITIRICSSVATFHFISTPETQGHFKATEASLATNPLLLLWLLLAGGKLGADTRGRSGVATQPVRPETIERLASAVYPSFAMLAGMQLDLFTPLKDGPLTAAQLAGVLSVRADKLQPLLYALVVAGLLTVEGECFSNTPESDHFLVRGKPAYIGGRHEGFSRQWNGVLKTAETIRTGVPQTGLDFSAMSSEEAELYYRRSSPTTSRRARDLVARFDFSPCRNLLDVGGGSGDLSIVFTEACPQLKATVVDLPTVTPITQRFVNEAQAGHRVQVVAADVVKGPLEGSYDVAVMLHLIQLLSPDQARRAIHNASQAVAPGGWIYILGWVIDNSRVAPLEMVGLNLYYLNAFENGQAYTEQQHRDWLAEAGFVEGFERGMVPDGGSIMRARKPA
jgi:SAM-dependent methyltransferase